MPIPNHTHQTDAQGGQIDLSLSARRPGSIGQVDVADGTIGARRLVEIDASGDLVQASVGSTRVIGINNDADGKVATDPVLVAIGRVTAIADGLIDAGTALKGGNGGRPLQLVTAALAGVAIGLGAGGDFGNQPSNDGVEIVSDDAGDTTQSITITGTTTGTETVVVETVALNGTTPVSTVKTDWGEILAVELDAVAAGTVTVREASADLTITTLATTVVTAGIIETDAGFLAGRAFNIAPTFVGDNATTAIVGVIGTDVNHAAVTNNAIALNGTTAVTLPSAMNLVTRLLVGSAAAAVAVTCSVGAEEDELLKVGKAIEAAAAIDAELDILLLP